MYFFCVQKTKCNFIKIFINIVNTILFFKYEYSE